MNDLLIFLSFAAFVLSPCLIALRSRDQREAARAGGQFGGKLGPRLVPARAPRSTNAPRKPKKLIVDSLPASRSMAREARREGGRDVRREEFPRHTGPRASYVSSTSSVSARRRHDPSHFVPPARQVPALGYTASPVPALVYVLPSTSPDDLLLLVLPGGRVPQTHPFRSY